MASSSSSSNMALPRANGSKFDVFLSFRGEDTRHSFTDHLYNALKQAGILTFRDSDDAERGEELKEEIEKAIKASDASIIVLSENYATSTWCLDELSLILDQRRDCNHFVLPVFYHVDPSNVGKQKGSFEIQADPSRRRWTDDNVKRWKAALTEVVGVIGMTLVGSETKFIKEVVDTIYNRLDRKQIHIPANITGMDVRYEEINSLLKQSKAQFLVICGMAGSGKSTMAQYIVYSEGQQFESNSIVEKIGSRCKNSHEMVVLQEQLCSDISKGKQDRRIDTVCKGTAHIELLLEKTKALIVLDEIVEERHLEELLGSGNINKESKIIITTNNNDISNWFMSKSLTFQEYIMRLLNVDEALELLSLHAFRSKLPKDGYTELAQQVVRYCGGNPLALEVLGSSLSKKDTITSWKSELSSFGKSFDDRMYEVFIRSYNSLPSSSEKELFLHIACFFVGSDMNYVVGILEPDYGAESKIKTLTSRCFLYVTSDNKLMMHRLLQEMGRSLVDRESQIISERTRVWRNKDSYEILRRKKTSNTIEGLALDIQTLIKEDGFESRHLKELSTYSLRQMDRLKLLQFKFVKLDGSYEDLSENLRWLYWVGFSESTVPTDMYICMGNMVALDMSYSHLEEFEPPMNLPLLKILNLKDSHKLSEIRNFHKIPNLETLILWNCHNLVRVCRTIGNLERLALLNTAGCEKLFNRVELSFPLPHSLQRAFLNDCNLECTDYFPLSFSDQSFLQYINLANGHFESLPSYKLLKNLRVLDLRKCSRLKRLLCLPSTLAELYIYDCESIEKITFESGRFTLQEFGYEGCVILSEVESWFKLLLISKLDESDLGHMFWLKDYQYQEVCLVGDCELTKGRSCHLQMLYEFNIMSTSLPDIKHPKLTTKYTSPSPSLSFDVPLCPSKFRIKGLNVTFRYTISGDKWVWFVKIRTTNNVDLMYQPKVFGKPGSGNIGKWLSYWPIGNLLDVGDVVYMSIVVMSGLEVLECGASLVYTNDDVARDTIENKTGWVEALGEDLYRFKLRDGSYYLCQRDIYKLTQVGRLKPSWLSILAGYTIDDTEVRGWKMTGRPQQLYQSFKELKTIRCIIHGPDTRMFSPDDFAHFRVPLQYILSATNNFSEENRIYTRIFAKEYKGQLLWSGELIDVTAKRWNKERKEAEQEFWIEISMLSSLKHKNLVSLVGFCDENDEKIIIIRGDTRGCLENYLSDSTRLTWVRRLEISVGLAHALSYIHYDESRDFSVIHRNISSYSVLLNKYWEPILWDFQHSLKIKESERHDAFHTDSGWSTKGYTESVNHKSDIYSFGIVLFELLCGRNSVFDDQDNKFLAPVAIFHYRAKILEDIIDPDLWKQMDPQSLNIFAKTAYDCLNEGKAQHPNIDEIVTRLEKSLELQMESENTVFMMLKEQSIVGADVEGTSSTHDEGSVTFISTHIESHVSKKTKSFLKDLSHLKLSWKDIKSATNNFADKNIIEKFKHGRIFEGRLLHSEQFIDIIVKKFYSVHVQDESKRFWTEVSMLYSLKHKNLVSLIGFCDDEKEKIIVYKKEANESLEKYLSDQTLTWMQRLEMCVSVAKALSYIHYDAGRDFSVIHCNIRSSKILLDDNWEPKLSGFELSLKNTVARRHCLLLTRDIVKNVYLDPKYEKTGGVTHKSDVYSFGVVLFEVLCGRSAVIPEEELGEGLLSQLANSHLDDIIDEHLRNQMDQEALKIFSETAYCCIREERADRPYIDQVVKRLEKVLELQSMYQNPELTRNAVDSTSSNHLRWKNLEHLKIGLNDIEMATEKFADKYCIGSDAYGMVYKAQLEHFDSSISSSIDGENKCDLPKKRSTVAIKRIHNREGEQWFIAEIEILTSCKHENIISLLGFCDEDRDHMILVYELASKGSLEDYMGNNDRMTNLNWMQRLKICLDIAHGLNYIHTNTDLGKQKIIHRDVKSANILLGENWEVKIANFGLSKIFPADQADSTIYTSTIAGTYMYLDPEYEESGRLNKKSDIYSFGVVLLEILTGRLAYDDRIFTYVDGNGIAPIARHHFEKGTLMEIVDHKIKEETDEHIFSLSKGPNKESLDIFSKIAFRCIAETQVERPSIDVVISELKKALYFQENHTDKLKLSLQEIKLATKTFNQDNLIGYGNFGYVYKGHTHGHNFIAAKRLGRKSAEGEAEFMTELEILMEYKHENVIGLVGYCDEEDEKIIVYEYASRGSLDKYLSDDSLTWVMRLKICIDIAIGLEFLHGTVSSPEMVIHRDISSSNVLLFDDWKAKITDFGLSLVCPTNQDVDYVIDNVTGTIGYRDPLYSKTGFLTKESDIFSLGAVLFDILCGKLSSEKLDDEYLYLPFLAKQHYHLEKLDELVFEGIKEQIVPQSYSTFTRIALQCLHHRRERRPTAYEVIIQLKKALEFQVDFEIWELKLPKDYNEIIQMSKCPEDYMTIKKEDLYNIFSKGILLQQDKVLLSFDGIGERNALVSATMFSYKSSCPHEWKSLPESRFESVAEMSDVSNLNIEIKTDTRLLSPNVVYGVYLLFKLCDSRKVSTKPMYVNLKYRVGSENLHAYFAKQRDEEWMMIELYRFLNQNEDVMFTFLIESFSSCYCGDGAIYVEGIEFLAIDKVKHEEIGKLKEVQQVLESNFNVDHVQQLPANFEEIFEIHRNYDELFWLGEVNGKKLLVVSAKAALYKVSNVDLFTSKPSSQSRFQEVIELLPQQVFYINCTIRSQMLSPDTEYLCCLVFKLSEECHGLHNPVKVRDLLHQVNEEAEFFYFITPSPLNINGITGVPKQREDGWMEIQVWKFNTACEFKDDSLSINMKFTSPEGSMSGLIVCGLEFRPMFSGNSDDIQRQREKKKRLQDEVPKPTHAFSLKKRKI